MEQAYQATEIDKAKIVGDFYYTLTLLQTKAIKHVANGENDDDKVVRAKTLIEQVREIIKSVEETGLEQPLETECIPPCYRDDVLNMCICPKINTQC